MENTEGLSAQSYRTAQKSFSSESDSSGSDSGDDAWKRKGSRKRGLPLSPVKTVDSKPPMPTDNSCDIKKKKFNTVWCNVLQEQSVADDLVQFGIKTKPISYQDRSCESYDFRLGALDPRRDDESQQMEDDAAELSGAAELSDDDEEDDKEEESENFKRRARRQPARRRWPKCLRESKEIMDKTAKKIIKVLSEPKHYMINKVVQVVGTEKALELLKETEKIEENGGMFVLDNSRLRTPGGTYLHLLKIDSSISNKKKNVIFSEERRVHEKLLQRMKRRKKAKAKKVESMDIGFEFADKKNVVDKPVKEENIIDEPIEQNIVAESVAEDSAGNCDKVFKSSGSSETDVQFLEETPKKVYNDSEVEEGEISD